MNAHEVLTNLHILVCPKKAATLRLLQHFQYVSRKYAHEMITDNLSSHFNYKLYIKFAMDTMKSACHHTFHNKTPDSSLHSRRPGDVFFMTEVLHEIPLIIVKENLCV